MDEPVLLVPLGEGCACVATHSPVSYVPHRHHVIPKSWDGPDIESNIVTICPNTHTATHRLLNEYVRQGGEPSWEYRRQFGPYVRALAARGWAGRPEKPTYTLAHH